MDFKNYKHPKPITESQKRMAKIFYPGSPVEDLIGVIRATIILGVMFAIIWAVHDFWLFPDADPLPERIQDFFIWYEEEFKRR